MSLEAPPIERTCFERWCDLQRERLMRPALSIPIIIVLIGAYFLFNRGADPDLFARVAMGRLVDRDGRVPVSDPFAFTPKKPVWIDHEWLAGAVFWNVARLGGDTGPVLFKFMLAAAAIALLGAAQSVIFQRARGKSLWLLLAA